MIPGLDTTQHSLAQLSLVLVSRKTLASRSIQPLESPVTLPLPSKQEHSSALCFAISVSGLPHSITHLIVDKSGSH